MFKVMEEKCDQCLFSEDRIVSKERMADIVKQCRENDSYFICHKATIAGNQQVCCRGFYDTQDTQIIQVANRLGVTQFIKEKDL